MDSNLFISWSGEKSKCVALALKEFLPLIINAAKPFLSIKSIDKGMRWNSEIAIHLKQAKLGIICLTPENLDSPWILFEAGALANTVDRAFVCPYLYKVQPTEIKDPLSQFQATKTDKEDTKDLIYTINRAINADLPKEQIDKSFDRFWPDLEDDLKEIPEIQITEKKIDRTTKEMLEEVLELTRSLARKPERPHIWFDEEDLAGMDEDAIYEIASTICQHMPEKTKDNYLDRIYEDFYSKWRKTHQEKQS